MVEALVEEDLDGGHGGVAKAGRQRRAELGELYVVEPVLEASLEARAPRFSFFSLIFFQPLSCQLSQRSSSYQVDDPEGREGDVPAPVDLLAALEDLGSIFL